LLPNFGKKKSVKKSTKFLFGGNNGGKTWSWYMKDGSIWDLKEISWKTQKTS